MIVPCQYYSTFIYFLATFYIIFGTNILIQCLVLVPVCCMFFVSQNIHIKRNPNGIKMDGELFWNICDFWEENQREMVPEVATRVRGAPDTLGRAPYLVGPSSIVSRGFFFPKIIYIPKKSLSVFIPFGLRLIWIFCETKNTQQTGTGTGH